VSAAPDLAPGAVVHAGVELGDGVVVEAGAVLGKRPRLRPGSSAPQTELGALVVAPGATLCAGAVVDAGAVIGPGAIIGDQAHVREGVVVGAGAVIGRGSAVEFGVQIGARALIQSNVYVTAGTVVEDDVFIGPGVVMTNDDTMGRHRAGEQLRGALLRRACRVGGAAVLVPGVEIGAEAFVAAGAVVTRDVGPGEVVMGVPARVVRRVPEEDLIERWR
jgi:acetyltransferase-like isoleucine patch superfamily enzyme